MNMKLFLLSFTVLFSLFGCTSLKDFQKMDTSARAQFVCSRDSSYNQFRRLESNYQSKINDTNNVLSRGYRIHKSCKTVRIDSPGSISCASYGSYSNRNTNCTQETKTSYEDVCTESPVSIDANLEKENIEKYEELMKKTKTNKNAVYNDCYSKIKPMSAEQAFQYYDK